MPATERRSKLSGRHGFGRFWPIDRQSRPPATSQTVRVRAETMTPACSSSDRFHAARRRLRRFGLLAALLATPRPSLAQEGGSPVQPDGDRDRDDDRDSETDAEADAGSEARPKMTKKRARRKHDVRLTARFLALAELSHRRTTVVGADGSLDDRYDALDLSLQSARAGAKYRSPLRWLSAEAELELSRKPRVKDAYVEAGKRFFARAGQFKLPAARPEMVSLWSLPQARRGLVHDLLTDWNDIAGRAPGVAFGYRGAGPQRLRLVLGAFQGSTLKQVLPGDRDVELVSHASLGAQTFAARAQVTLVGVAWGAWYEQRVVSRVIGQFRHLPAFGVDAGWSVPAGPGALGLWLDVTAARGLYPHPELAEPGNPWLLAGRALVSYRFGGRAVGERYLESFAFLAALDPDLRVRSDRVLEAALGLGLGYFQRARLTLAGEVTRARRNFPSELLGGQEPEHASLLLQAGARF